jgi:hypothetical protein
MAIYRGFIRSLQIRDDGWVEFVLQAVHAGNSLQTFFIRDLDGDILKAHKRLAHLSLLRDALARILPIEVEYDAGGEQGNIVEDLTVYPRPSIDGRLPGRRIEGVVIGLMILDRGPESGTSPYRDEADLASVTLLTDAGTLDQVLLDLQRPDAMTAHAMLGLLREAHRTRRPVAVLVSTNFRDQPGPRGRAIGAPFASSDTAAAATETGGKIPDFIQACEWITVPDETLDYLYAFIERLGQRYESYEADEAPALSHVRVLYTTAPGQTPEGDVSDNGAFTPQTAEAWVHDDSPLLVRLEAALRDRLQVKLGLKETRVHEVEMVAHLGSAARPIWIQVNRTVLPPEPDNGLCENVPTIRTPTASAFNGLPQAIAWRGHAYFNEGIWRFVVKSIGSCKLLIDGETPCCERDSVSPALGVGSIDLTTFARSEQSGRVMQCHAYLNGMHLVELILNGHTCEHPFQLLAYRIR